jgi:hypothetical protein
VKPLAPEVIDPIPAFRANVLRVGNRGREIGSAGHDAEGDVSLEGRPAPATSKRRSWCDPAVELFNDCLDRRWRVSL